MNTTADGDAIQDSGCFMEEHSIDQPRDSEPDHRRHIPLELRILPGRSSREKATGDGQSLGGQLEGVSLDPLQDNFNGDAFSNDQTQQCLVPHYLTKSDVNHSLKGGGGGGGKDF